MQAQDTHARRIKQARRTLRNLIRPAYPYDPPANARFETADYVELAALAMGRRTSISDASITMRDRGNTRLPHADTFHEHPHALDEDPRAVLDAFNTALDGIIDAVRPAGWLPAGPVAIDGHCEPYHGDHHNDWVVGNKGTRGTNWAHKYLTSQRIQEPKIQLGLEPVTPKRGRSSALASLVLSTMLRMEVTLWLLDREFYNRMDLRTLMATGRDFAIPVPRDRRPRQQEDAAWRAKSRVGARYVSIMPHDAGDADGSIPVFHVYQWRPDEKEPSGWRLFVYATPHKPTLETADARADEYRTRWTIETGYRLTEEVRLRTTTTHYPNRLLLSCLALLLDAYWRLVAYAKSLRDPQADTITSRQLRGWIAHAVMEATA